jgi:fumarate reductase flavoprotein subunit
MSGAETTADLVVVGGGLGGLTAAVRAMELGLRVILLEKGDGERYPCNSRQSGGIVHICLLDIRRDADQLYDAILKNTGGEVNTAQARALADNGGRLIDWFQAHGGRFMRFNMEEAYRWCMAPPRAMVPGPDWEGRGPDVLLQELMRRFQAGGGKASLKTRALRLVMEGGACKGVIASVEGRETMFRAAAVLLADGGFQGNRQDFEAHIGPNFDDVFQRGASTGMGDGIRMAEAVGARLTSRRRFYGHLLCREARQNEKLWPYPELDAFTTPGVIVGRDGKRLANEGAGGISVANALAQLPNAGSATAVFDAAIWEGPGKAHRIPANPLLEQGGATIHRAETIEELAAKIGVPAEALAETVARHNAAVDSGDFSGLTPPRQGKIKAMPIRTAPLMAIEVMPGITYTMGGIEIDEHARALSADGKPIPGLFAAGATTGGLEGGGANAYIGGLVKAGVFGLLAAEEAARTLGKSDVAATDGKVASRFQMLDRVVRYGGPAAYLLSPLAALALAGLTWGPLGWFSLPLGAVAGGVTYVLIRCFVEIVILITELLVPK